MTSDHALPCELSELLCTKIRNTIVLNNRLIFAKQPLHKGVKFQVQSKMMFLKYYFDGILPEIK